ncbi:MAG: RluA family pseudouridine synthase [Candidatus Izemoplasmatales bacterium]|nr:RluA family pseudouridine synthase [Candidatus Izemoplasmatales bacterium]
MDDIFFEYLVTENDETDRIDRFLAIKIESLSRSTIKKLLLEGKILVNQTQVKASYVLRFGDLIEVMDVDFSETEIVPTKMDLDIVYEDEDVLVVNKPSGMVVHPAPGHYQDTLVNGLLWHIKNLSDVNGEMRPGIVHRIDKDTSGLLMVAKNNYAHDILAKELQEKLTKREYIALVEGIIVNKRGKINAPIGRDKNNRLKMAVTASGKEAITNFEVLETYEDKTLIKCILETGRTHQIRVHMQYINHPLVNDYVYGNAKPNDFGQFLHAESLGFTHPKTKKWLEFTSPLPEEFKSYLEKLKN